MPSQLENIRLSTLRWPAAGAFLCNVLRAAYTQLFGLMAISAAINLWTLACLLVIYRQISLWNSEPTPVETCCVVVPLRALAAWLTAASIVNISASLRFHGIEASDAAAPLIGAAGLLLGGAIASLKVALGKGNLVFAMTFLWALTAVYAAGGQAAAPVGFAAILAATLVLGAILAGRRGAARYAGT